MVQAREEGAHDMAMSDLAPTVSSARPDGVATRVAYAIGAFGILAATAADALGVAGRHTGIAFLGSIELVQAAVVLLAATSMFVVTIAGSHASVHIVTSRLKPDTASRMARIAALLSAIAFLLLATGSAWVLAELWNGYEQTEILHIPIRWLRLVWIVFALLTAGLFLRAALRRAA